MTGRVMVSAGLVLVILAAGGCKKKAEKALDYTRPLPPGAHALRKLTDPAMMPNFAQGFPKDRSQLVTAIDHSLWYLAHPSSQRYYPIQGITHSQAVESLKALRELILAVGSPEELQRLILEGFDVYQSVGCDDAGTVLFTGYYQPILEGSLERTGEYRYPLYKLPPDLVKDAEGECLGRRLADGRIVPYPGRRELETGGMPAGLELVYLKDKFDAYIAHVQGSAKIRLADGRWFEVGYAGRNGAAYTSISQMLVDEGKIAAEKRSLATVRAYFRAHPEEVDRYTHKNERFIFFQPTSGGPFGSLGVPVTPYRSLATDKTVFPRGCATFVVTHVPVRQGDRLVNLPFSQFMLDQDTGGAIRAAGRGDIYLGVGHEAGQIAGWTMSEGKLYYLFLKGPSAAP